MDRLSIDQGAAQTAAALRVQLAQMAAAAQVLERGAWDEKGRRYLAVMDQGICRMLRIVGRLELAGRLGDGGTGLEAELTDLAALTRQLGERLSGLLALAGVELTVDTPEWLGALADEGLIRQMLMELVSNAAKAGTHVSLTLVGDGERARFTVEDDGPGLEAEQLGWLFSNGGQEGPGWKRGGVGVAIARRAADLHGGALVADCAPGRGLRVVASLPLGKPGERAFQAPGLSWDRGGFDEAMVALSDILPLEAFGPGGGAQ